MAKEVNREIYQRLAEGCTSRRSLDEPTLSLKHIFLNIAVEFKNKMVIVNLPADAYDIDVIVNTNPNDYNMMQVTQDYKSYYFGSIIYKYLLLTLYIPYFF